MASQMPWASILRRRTSHTGGLLLALLALFRWCLLSVLAPRRDPELRHVWTVHCGPAIREAGGDAFLLVKALPSSHGPLIPGRAYMGMSLGAPTSVNIWGTFLPELVVFPVMQKVPRRGLGPIAEHISGSMHHKGTRKVHGSDTGLLGAAPNLLTPRLPKKFATVPNTQVEEQRVASFPHKMYQCLTRLSCTPSIRVP